MSTKTCVRCKAPKLLDEFVNDNRRPDGKSSYCVACSNAKNRECYARHRKARRKRNNVHARARRIRALKMHGSMACEICGESRPWCLDFHHRDPTAKDSTIRKLLSGKQNIERLAAELKKCDVLCRNCHADVHWAYNVKELECLI